MIINVIERFQNITNECQIFILLYFIFMIGDTLVYKNYVIKFIIFLTSPQRMTI